MFYKKLNRVRRSERGQIMVLGVMGIMLVAMMMLLTLNIGQSVYEKIRIQQVADSGAFSTAVVEARSYNFYAYTNRANISGLVAAASAHGFMSLASTVPEMFKTAGMNFFIMAGIEIGLCCACPYCSCVQHCIHALRDALTGWEYMDRGGELEDDLQDTSNSFINAIKMLDLHMKFIAAQQQGMRAWVEGYQLLSDKTTGDIVEEYSPGSNNLNHVAIANVAEYESTIEGDSKKRQWVATDIANGTRHKKFVYNRCLFCFDSGNILAYIRPDTIKELVNDIPQDYTNGFSAIVYHEGESRIVKGGSGVESKIGRSGHGPEGDAAAGADSGWVASYAYCAGMASMYKASVGSDYDSGEHKCKYFFGIPGSCCDDESAHDDAFKCLREDGLIYHNCFMLFDAEKDSGKDFNQPRVYAAIESDLRRRQGEGQKQVWEITEGDSGKVGMDLGGDIGRKDVQLTDNPDEFGKGVAISKALVYYHWPDWSQGGWKEHPNFFNPYWRAKLQPFKGTTEVTIALGPYAGKYGALLLGGLLASPPLP